MDFQPYFKVHNLVSVHPKSVILGQMTNLNMVFHMVVSVNRLVKILKLAPVPWWISERLIVCCCIHEQKMNFEGFTQNGCYGNQWQPLEVLFDSTYANNPCPFTKQDLIFKQAYIVGFCFVLFNKQKFWQLLLVFSVLYRLYLEIALFCTKPSEQIVYCHVTDVKMLKKN